MKIIIIIIIIIIYQNKIKYLTIAYVQFYINCFSASYSYNRHIDTYSVIVYII